MREAKTPIEGTWQEFERLVAAIHKATAAEADVRWDDTINGRQFDVTIRFKKGLQDFLTVIECKHQAGRVQVTDVEAFITKARDALASKIVVVSSSGFQEGCNGVAERHGVQLITLEAEVKHDFSKLTSRFLVAARTWDVRFVVAHTKRERALRDEGGSLAYFVKHVEIVTPQQKSNPARIIENWHAERNPKVGFAEDVEIAIPQPATARIPYESSVQVSALRFHYAVEETLFIGGIGEPQHDPFVRHAMSTVYSAIDHKGAIVAKVPARGLKRGIGTKVTPGKFYENPTLKFWYYCDGMTPPDLMRMILLESYQHGTFIQAEFTQKEEYAEHFVEVTEAATLRRLKAMLEGYKARPKKP